MSKLSWFEQRVERWGARGDMLLLVVLGVILYLPGMGSVGLWDPWETHYAEVAREMLARGDFLHPFWESAYFFSKPILSFWLMALPMAIVGVNSPEQGVSQWVELAVRLPFAMLAIMTMVLLYLAVARCFKSRIIAVIASLVMATSPQFLFIAKQAMTDMPFVALTTSALACFMSAVFVPEAGEKEHFQPRRGFLLAFYIFCALATLAKGLLGFALPGAVILLYLLISGEWWMLKKLRIIKGGLLFLLMAAPWYLLMSFFPGKDDEGKNFVKRFFIHDHLNRLSRGVHGSRGTFSFYLDQLAFAAFPWSAFLPATLHKILNRFKGVNLSSQTGPPRALLFFLLWFILCFTLFTLSITKFHHYILPALPPLAVLTSYYLSQFWQSSWLSRENRNLLVMLLCLLLFIFVARDISMKPKHLLDLFVYNYQRPYPYHLDARFFFSTLFTAAGAVIAVSYLFKWHRILLMGTIVSALIFSLFLSHYHFRVMSPNWSQRQIFNTYYQLRENREPIAAYLMNWRGETFYSCNTVVQIKKVNKLKEFLSRKGREFVIVEQRRYKKMLDRLGTDYRQKAKIVDKSSNKFFLVQIDGL